ncbi:hypothetical protein QQY79_15150 [Flavobacterium tructae]|uniref:hypothetical protein n=1 Tax=Flavobacterium tructae TaxID=1114873 RepID=UPI0025520B90|nr:hypothetical protein [Flavobacterium tructae]MDL2143863.1 hypothetical protein [Flavobacterium tructae]
MKKIILFLVLGIMSNSSFSQTAFYEAQYLNTIDIGVLDNILDKAIPAGLSNYEITVVKDYRLFVTNPFDSNISNLDINELKSSIDKYNAYVEFEHKKEIAFLQGGSVGNEFVSGAILSMIPSILGGKFSLNSEQQTKIIDGLTKYYAEEFRKAQLLTYMQTFENTIGEVGELQVLLPQTYSKLQSADPSKFPELGDEYKTIFNEDLKLLPDNLINHIDNHTANGNPPLESKLKWLTATNVAVIKSNDYYTTFKLSTDIGSKLINNYHPVDLLNFIDNKYYNSNLITSHSKNSEKIILILHGLNLVQRNMLDTTKLKTSQFSNIWLNLLDLRALDTDKKWKYFAGLLYQQDKEFFNQFIWNGTNKTLVSVTAADISLIKERITKILTALVELQNFRANLNDENIKENFATYMSLLLKTITATNYFTSQSLPVNDYNKYLKIANYTMNIYDNARKKDYNNTIYYTIEILNDLLIKDNSYIEVINTIENYGSFMTDVIDAKNSDEVKECIKKHAAPPTSFILKREYRWMLTITGQPGYFVSIEKLDGSNQKFSFVSGITLPMGFEVTFKTKHGNENSDSIGIFAQILDLGAVLNFRVDDFTSTLPDKIEFQQIFSPGGSITYGFKNSPLTLGLGYQYTPQLREITENGNNVYPNGHRIFLRLAWDIPFINIVKSKFK